MTTTEQKMARSDWEQQFIAHLSDKKCLSANEKMIHNLHENSAKNPASLNRTLKSLLDSAYLRYCQEFDLKQLNQRDAELARHARDALQKIVRQQKQADRKKLEHGKFELGGLVISTGFSADYADRGLVAGALIHIQEMLVSDPSLKLSLERKGNELLQKLAAEKKQRDEVRRTERREALNPAINSGIEDHG